MIQQKLNGNEIVLLARTLAPSLGKKERAIARFIENNPDTLAKTCITDMSKFLKVSVSSITKVAKKLGFTGFHELKSHIAIVVDRDDDYFPSFPEQCGSSRAIVEESFLSAILALQDSLATVNMETFNQVVELIANGQGQRKIILAGCGGSGAICDDFHHKLLKIGIFANVYHDSHLQQMAASLMQPEDILLGVSHSGKTTDIINMMKTAKDNQAKTICLTNYLNSPLSRMADYALVSAVRNNPITGENASTRIVHLTILDALFTVVAHKRSQLSQSNLQKTRNSILTKRASD